MEGGWAASLETPAPRGSWRLRFLIFLPASSAVASANSYVREEGEKGERVERERERERELRERERGRHLSSFCVERCLPFLFEKPSWPCS